MIERTLAALFAPASGARLHLVLGTGAVADALPGDCILRIETTPPPTRSADAPPDSAATGLAKSPVPEGAFRATEPHLPREVPSETTHSLDCYQYATLAIATEAKRRVADQQEFSFD